MWPTQWMFVLMGLLLVALNNAQVCSNGLTGVESAGACCVAECGQCGGSVCGGKATDASLTADDCCVGRIKQAEVYCSESGAAPCLIDDDSTCSNDLSGVEADGVCCVAQCKKCNDSGCGGRANAAGLTEDDCCIERILDSNVFCGDSETAPCIIDPEVCGPALTITLEWSDTGSALRLLLGEPDGNQIAFSGTVGNVGFIDVSMGPGIQTYTTFSGLDPTMVDVIGTYTFAVVLADGTPSDTMYTLVATLLEEVVVRETGSFTGISTSESFAVTVVDYDPTCEDGTEAFTTSSGGFTSRDENSSP